MDDHPLDPQHYVGHNRRRIVFTRSSRKHRIAYDDIRHAITNGRQLAVRPKIDTQRDARIMYLGPARDGTPLEVVITILPDGSVLVIHAMHMRTKFVNLYQQKGSR